MSSSSISEPTTGRALIRQALSGKAIPRTPWVPFTGVQIANLVGKPADAYLRDVNAIVAANVEAARRYRSDGQCVMFDLQIEAEIFGCDLHWPDNAPPSVTSHPLMLEGLAGVDKLTIPTMDQGRLPISLEATRRVSEQLPDTALFGLLTGPFTLASHLRGPELFMDMFDDPQGVTRLIEFCGQVGEAIARAYLDAGADVIATVDPMISQISEEHFNTFVSPTAISQFAAIREHGGLGCFFVCGNATRILKAMANCRPEGICVDENVDLHAALEATEPGRLAVGGNLPLATVMLLGSPSDNIANALSLIDRHGSTGRYILAPGCDMPFDTPPENIEAIGLAVHDREAAQQILYDHPPTAAHDVDVDLPDYEHLDKPLVEVVTLDSRSCAACGYMVGATKALAEKQPGTFDWVEHSILDPQNVARVKKLGLTHLPSILINGKLVFESLIPSHDEYAQRIAELSQGRGI